VTLAKNLADKVSQSLMSKYSCALGQDMINKRHELGVDDPVAQLLNQYFTVSTPKRVIDDSPGEDEGEIDHLGRDAAVEYLLMLERVKKVEGQVELIGSDLEAIKSDLRRIADALGKIYENQRPEHELTSSTNAGANCIS
jgi:hypothetical protein